MCNKMFCQKSCFIEHYNNYSAFPVLIILSTEFKKNLLARLQFRKIPLKILTKRNEKFDSPFYLVIFFVLSTLIKFTVNDVYSIKTESGYNTLNITGNVSQYKFFLQVLALLPARFKKYLNKKKSI